VTEKINIFKLNNVFIIKKEEDSNFFFATKDSITIPMFNFSAIIKFMLFRGLLSPKILESVLEEYHNRND
jgi:hypothetical protein